MDPFSAALSRRRLLRLAGAGLFSAVAGSVLAGGAKAALSTAAKDPLQLWWWGEVEAVGITAWLNDTIKKFKQQSGYDVKTLQMTTDAVIPQFTNAAAAGKPPDVQFLWNGIFHMENVWKGYVAPLNGLVSRKVLANSGATVLSNYKKKTYRTGFYGLGFGIQYDKAAFEKAGLNPDTPPKSWDAFLNACDKLKAKNITPFSAGVKDGWFGEWWFSVTALQNMNSPAEALKLFTGQLSWDNPKYHEHWVRLGELKSLGYFNNDVTSLTLGPGFQKVEAKQAAMTLNNTPYLPSAQKKMGDRLGFFPMPTYGKGKMAGLPVVDAQGFGIPAKAKNPAAAAAFINFMHSDERVNAMWKMSKAIPAGENFNSKLIRDPFMRKVYNTFFAAPHAVYLANLMPGLFWTDAMQVISQKVLGGTMDPKSSGELADSVTKKWIKQNPSEVAHYRAWTADLKQV